jgi:hypothetical protein
MLMSAHQPSDANRALLPILFSVNSMKLQSLKKTTFNVLMAVPLVSSLQAQSAASQYWTLQWPIGMHGAIGLSQAHSLTNSFLINMALTTASKSDSIEDESSPKSKLVIPRHGAIATSNELVAFMAKTGPWTVKVHSGPGSGFPEADTIAAHQVVTFNAWTFGPSVPDAWTQQPDARWYRIAGTNHWIASAVINGNAPGSRPLP